MPPQLMITKDVEIQSQSARFTRQARTQGWLGGRHLRAWGAGGAASGAYLAYMYLANHTIRKPCCPILWCLWYGPMPRSYDGN